MCKPGGSSEHESSRWTGYSEPIKALMTILAIGALCFLIVGRETR